MPFFSASSMLVRVVDRGFRDFVYVMRRKLEERNSLFGRDGVLFYLLFFVRIFFSFALEYVFRDTFVV